MTVILEPPAVSYKTTDKFLQNVPDVGWGFIVAWGLATVFSPVFSEGDTANMGAFWLASMLGAPIGLLLFFLLPVSLNGSRAQGLAQNFALSGMTLGLALLEISLYSPSAGFTLQIGGGFVSALGTAIFTVLWGAHYASLDMKRIERMATCSLIVAFACYALILVLPRIAAVVIIGCLPFLSSVCLSIKHQGGEGVTSPAHSDSIPTNGLGNLNVIGFMRLGLGIVGATTVVSLFWTLTNSGVIHVLPNSLSTSMLSGSIVAVLIMAYLSRFARSLNLGTLYRWVLPLIAVSFSLLMFGNEQLTIGSSLLINASQALLNLTTFIYFAELSQRTGALAVRVFGLGRFFLEAGFLLGLLSMPLAKTIASITGSYQGALFIFLTALIVLVMISIANQDQLAFTLSDNVSPLSKNDAPVHSGKNDNDLGSQASEGSLSTNEQTPKDLFGATCDRVADEFELTKREREILPYLAQGYSLPYIRNELYIAQSTIDTHVRHIYKKMDLHSKEELITYVRLHS